MKTTIISALLVLSVGCANMPQTREEFTTSYTSDSRFVTHGTHTSKLSYTHTIKILNQHLRECFNVARNTKRSEGGATTMNYTDTWKVSTQKVSASFTKFTIQQDTTMMMLNKVPDGGFFVAALDAKKTRSNKAQLTWYSDYSWSKEWEAAKRWADGKSSDCQYK